MLTRSIPQSGTGGQTVHWSPDPATDGLTDSSALGIGRRRHGKERQVRATRWMSVFL
jgi:hypothetical protein